MEKQMIEESTYNYVFHYNGMLKTWFAIPRDLYLEYWSNPKKDKKFLKSSNINTLVELIRKGDKFIKTIK